MSVFHSVRTRIIILSVLLFASFIAAYTFTVWTVANGYALVDSSQNRSFSLNLVVSEMEEMLDNVDALITRISIDNELKAALSYGDMRDYYDSFSAMIQANPAFGVIERFIATDRSYSDFLQVGSTSISEGRPLRQDYFLDETEVLSPSGSGFTGPYASPLSYRRNQVLGQLRPIIDYNTGLTLGYLYVSINIDHLLDGLYSYQEMDSGELYIDFGGHKWRIEDHSLVSVENTGEDGELTGILSNEVSRVYRTPDGRYLLKRASGHFTVNEVYDAPSLLESHSTAYPLVMMGLSLAFLILLLVLILSLYLTRTIYKPVRRLAGRIEKIQHSDFSRDELIETDDEFGIIGRGINKLSSEVTDLMDKRVEDERRKMELEYRMLQNQINPHFLYNTFNSIKWMATIQGADGITEMVTALSRLMKNISKRDDSVVPLSDELAFIDDYMTIMKYRYGNTLSYVRSVHPGTEWVNLPRFTLQPLVENAIFHGIEPRGTGAIAIVVQAFDDHATVMVADNGVGFTKMGESKKDGVFKNIGIDNIVQRLNYTFKDAASFSIDSWPGVGTRCTIMIKREKGGSPDGL